MRLPRLVSRSVALLAILGAASCRSKPADPLEASPSGATVGSQAAGSTAAAATPAPGTGEVIYRDATGRVVTAQELVGASGSFEWSIVGGAAVPQHAQDLHEQARAAGAAGEYAKALELLAQAQVAAPSWPYPLYDTAYTYELMDRPDRALAAYEQLLVIAPRGYFTALTSADCLRREAAHEWKPGACKKYLMIEWLDEAAKRAALEALVAEAPGMAAAWKELAFLTDDDARRLQVLETGLSHRPDPETRGVLLINKALVLGRSHQHDEAVRILGELILDPTSPLDIVQMAKASLTEIIAAPAK